MYSVTVAKYPHWVDFDAGDVKNIKGFTYLPRQDNRNGNIKDYDIFVSQDGKNWGEAIHKGSFENNQKEKKRCSRLPSRPATSASAPCPARTARTSPAAQNSPS